MRSLLIIAALGALTTSCATTPHGQAVQQTAAGAVLLSAAIGGTVGTVGAVVSTASLPGDARGGAILGTVGVGVVTTALYITSVSLLSTGAATLDAEAPKPEVVERIDHTAPRSPRTYKKSKKRKAVVVVDDDDAPANIPPANAAQQAVFETCVDGTLCFAGDARCIDNKRMDFDEASNKQQWLDDAGCTAPATAPTTAPTTTAPTTPTE